MGISGIPFTQMQEWETDAPPIIEKGKGPLIDTEGRKYLDGTSSVWVNLHGHRHPGADRPHGAAQADRTLDVPWSLQSSGDSPGEGADPDCTEGASPAVFYSDNGSTAVEIALKMAVQYWQQAQPAAGTETVLCAFKMAYHGDTIGAVSVGNIELFHGRFKPLLFPRIRSSRPTVIAVRWDAPTLLRHGLHRPARSAAEDSASRAGWRDRRTAGAGGGRDDGGPARYLGRVRELCTTYKVLLIVDEVATGSDGPARCLRASMRGDT